MIEAALHRPPPIHTPAPSRLDLKNGQIVGDVLACVNRLVKRPVWVAIGGARSQPANVDPERIAVFDLGAPIEQQKWCSNEHASIPRLRNFATAALPNGAQQVMITGGYYMNVVANAGGKHCVRYSHSTGTCDPYPTNLILTRIAHTAVSMPDGRICVVGGSLGEIPRASLEVLNPQRTAWQCCDLPQLPPIAYHACVALDSTALMTVGGATMLTVHRTDLEHPTPARIDLASLQTTKCANFGCSPADMLIFNAMVLNDRAVYVMHHSLAGRYDAREDRWHPLAPPSTILAEPAAARVDPTSLALIGYSGGQYTHGFPATHTPTKAECIVYDARADAWRDEPRWALCRAGHQIVTM